MAIKRTSREFQKNWLSKNSNLKILDLGCSNVSYWKEANYFSDIFDYKEFFAEKNLKFTQIKPGENLPFENKEFDYVILSHVLEHVPNIKDFKSEIERISKSGYIEVPTRFADNIVFDFVEEKYNHKWWLEFDDVDQSLIYSPKINILQQFVSVGTLNNLQKYFDDSFTLQLYWEDTINLKETKFNYEINKFNFFDLQRKYYGKKIRLLKSKIKNFFKV